MHAPSPIRDGRTAFKRSGWAKYFVFEGFFPLLTKLNLPLPHSSLSVSQHLYFILLPLSSPQPSSGSPVFFCLCLFCPSELMGLATPHPCCCCASFLTERGDFCPLSHTGQGTGLAGGRSCPMAFPLREVQGEQRRSSVCLPSQSRSRNVCD